MIETGSTKMLTHTNPGSYTSLLLVYPSKILAMQYQYDGKFCEVPP